MNDGIKNNDGMNDINQFFKPFQLFTNFLNSWSLLLYKSSRTLGMQINYEIYNDSSMLR